ncbi:hypothetical protein HanIR_Chr07g0310561 [Helianthus annuus]|nr:hypothetical protein HanIR_Chr07g0310561 [Helianthus annuus]
MDHPAVFCCSIANSGSEIILAILGLFFTQSQQGVRFDMYELFVTFGSSPSDSQSRYGLKWSATVAAT